MATTLFKWLVTFLFILPHPLHISTTEINFNDKEKTLEISCRIFTDDFETILSRQFKTKVDLSNAAMKTAMDNLVSKYIQAHLQIKANDKTAAYSYLGFEGESDATYIYLEADNVTAAKKLEVQVSLLQDLYTDQSNIIHVKVGGTRKSTKLDYPVTQGVFSF